MGSSSFCILEASPHFLGSLYFQGLWLWLDYMENVDCQTLTWFSLN